MADRFYVYEHRRKDTGAVFYVGKGCGYRLRVEQHRNRHWRAVAGTAGYHALIVVGGLDEELAQLAECELIAKHRACGVALTNVTDGGGGMAGFRWEAEALARRAERQRGQKRPGVAEKLAGRPKSIAHRLAISEARKGFKVSDDVRAKMSAERRQRPIAMKTCECGITMSAMNFARWHSTCGGA